MSETGYIAAVLAIVFVITLALRAVPFLLLKPLEESKFVKKMASWMPAGILFILAASTFLTSTDDGDNHLLYALLAVLVTAGVHLVAGRRTLLSVGVGTLTYVVLVNCFTYV